MKILFFNIGYCTGISKKFEYITQCWRYIYSGQQTLKQLIDFVLTYNPDILALAEIDSGSFRGNFVNQIKRLADAGEFSTSLYQTKYKSKLLKKLPLFKNQCNALLLREREIAHRFHWFSCGIKRLVIQADITRNTSLFVIHLALGKKTRAYQIKELSVLIRNFSKENTIITGDFNTFGGIDELMPLLQNNNLNSVNGHHVPTFPSWAPKKELDFFLISPKIIVKRFDVLQSNLSDHLPIFLEIN